MRAEGPAAEKKPVLYLDLDDTIVCWASGDPEPAPGARDFLLWAMDAFEVRWLTTWTPSGDMDPGLLRDLSKLTDVDTEILGTIRGLDWEGGSKIDGIAWVEHVVMGRPFLWIEDDTIEPEALEFLVEYGYLERFIRCNVTEEPEMLQRLHEQLAGSLTPAA